MAAQFFGQYLLEKGIISREALLDALSLQKQRNLALGELAIEKGYLTEEQATRINIEQRRTDRRFGEIALDGGLLTDGQVSEVIELQKERRVFLGEALVQRGYLTEAQAREHLAVFEEEQRSNEVELNLNLEQVENSQVIRTFLSTTAKMFMRMLREQVKVSGLDAERKLETNRGYLYVQKTKGDLEMYFGFGLDVNHMLSMADVFFDEDKNEVDELVEDAAREFLNIISGNAIIKLGVEGIKLGLEPPLTGNREEIERSMEDIVRIRLVGTKGDLDVFFAF